MSNLWTNVTPQDIVNAIDLFDMQKESYPEARNTFLLYKNRKYPAKHIRGLAYKIANKKEISKNDYTGGKETADFFSKLGFTVEYKQHINAYNPGTKRVVGSVIDSKAVPKLGGKLNVVSQKNALQKILQKLCGCIETEKKFTWLKTPDPNNLPKDYAPIVKSLLKYRNQRDFLKANHSPICDIVIEDRKLIIEYDENQHFSKARQICLENYPSSIKLSYPKQTWIAACQKINAKDNFPIDRDERRAYYDTVRDIEAFKNGYSLIRIKHGEMDWEGPEAKQELEKMLSRENHKIARLVVRGKQYYRNGFPNYEKLQKVIEKFVLKAFPNQHFEFIITPGGFLKFEFPTNLQANFDAETLERQYIPQLKLEAKKAINQFLSGIDRGIFKKLKATGNFLTIGIDGENPFGKQLAESSNKKRIELVAVYDLCKEKIVRWTGKFYPTEYQKKTLVKIKDLKSHLIKLNNQNVVVLGCHDLSVFNPRGQASVVADSYKGMVSKKFKRLCKAFNPSIVLQHPHNTDSPYIWNLAWHTLTKELSQVQHFASGIKYFNTQGDPRGDLKAVLKKTKGGDVIDFKS